MNACLTVVWIINVRSILWLWTRILPPGRKRWPRTLVTSPAARSITRNNKWVTLILFWRLVGLVNELVVVDSKCHFDSVGNAILVYKWPEREYTWVFKRNSTKSSNSSLKCLKIRVPRFLVTSVLRQAVLVSLHKSLSNNSLWFQLFIVRRILSKFWLQIFWLQTLFWIHFIHFRISPYIIINAIESQYIFKVYDSNEHNKYSMRLNRITCSLCSLERCSWKHNDEKYVPCLNYWTHFWCRFWPEAATAHAHCGMLRADRWFKASTIIRPTSWA